jgi:predicted nuclease of predicted toxin-antitoxin system
VKLLLDQHLSRKLVPALEPAFPGTSHVIAHGLQTGDDDALWNFARSGGYAITSKDEDFQVLSFARGHPPKVIWLRSGNGPSSEILEILLRARPIIEAFGEDRDRSLLVLP